MQFTSLRLADFQEPFDNCVNSNTFKHKHLPLSLKNDQEQKMRTDELRFILTFQNPLEIHSRLYQAKSKKKKKKKRLGSSSELCGVTTTRIGASI